MNRIISCTYFQDTGGGSFPGRPKGKKKSPKTPNQKKTLLAFKYLSMPHTRIYHGRCRTRAGTAARSTGKRELVGSRVVG